jgi:hypothetical protein
VFEFQVEFVEIKKKKKIRDEDPVDNLRLLSGSKEVVKYLEEPNFIDTRQKVPIKRRKIDEELDESQKILESTIDATKIEEEIITWDKKVRHQPTEYKNIKNIGYLREPTNEFTKARNKNSWGESKIKTTKYHNPPMNDLIKR